MKVHLYTEIEKIVENYIGHKLIVIGTKSRIMRDYYRKKFEEVASDYGYGIHKRRKTYLHIRGTRVIFCVDASRFVDVDGHLFLFDKEFNFVGDKVVINVCPFCYKYTGDIDFYHDDSYKQIAICNLCEKEWECEIIWIRKKYYFVGVEKTSEQYEYLKNSDYDMEIEEGGELVIPGLYGNEVKS